VLAVTFRRGLLSAALLACLVFAGACDPVLGTGAGTPPDLSKFIRIDAEAQAVVLTLVAGYPAGDYQFNYNGYASGALVITVPTGWHATVQCENRGTVPNSCAVVGGKDDLEPLMAGWSTPDPASGLAPGDSAGFEFDPVSAGSFRIASLVKGSEASGMWAVLEVPTSGAPSMSAPWS
jgi:hypothetical protein